VKKGGRKGGKNTKGSTRGSFNSFVFIEGILKRTSLYLIVRGIPRGRAPPDAPSLARTLFPEIRKESKEKKVRKKKRFPV